MKRIFFLLSICVLLVLPAAAVAAQANQSIVIAADETIDHNYYTAAQDILIDGNVEGDVILAAQSIVINGNVSGDVIAAAQTIRIRGTVAGNVRVAASSVELDGSIGKNATVFTSTLEVGEAGTIGWSLLAFGSSLQHRGAVSGNLSFYGSGATFTGTVGGDVDVHLTEEGLLRLQSAASVGGDISYYSRQEADIDPSASVGGTLEQFVPSGFERQAANFGHQLWTFFRVLSLFGVVIVGLVLLAFMSKTMVRTTRRMQERFAASLGWGVVGLIVPPVVAGLLFVTLVGIPLGVLLLVLYGAMLYLTKVFVGLWLGERIFTWLRKDKPTKPVWSFLVGVIIFVLLTWIPYIGWLIGFVGALLALGGMMMIKHESVKVLEEKAE